MSYLPVNTTEAELIIPELIMLARLIAIILITHNEIHARLIADRYTFLSLGEVIGKGMAEELGGDDIKKLMAGGAEIGDLRDELGT